MYRLLSGALRRVSLAALLLPVTLWADAVAPAATRPAATTVVEAIAAPARARSLARFDASHAAALARVPGLNKSRVGVQEPGILAATCGDGMPGSGEQCDDDGTLNGDGCSATCDIELPYACSKSSGTSPMNDGGLEEGGLLDGSPNPFWTETGSQDLGGGLIWTPICSEYSCLGPDESLAIEGTHFAWFGGIGAPSPAPQVQTMAQTRTIAASRTRLSFFALRDSCTQIHTDQLQVSIDGNVVSTLVCNAVDTDWVLRSIDLTTAPGGPYNDGASHTIQFKGTTTAAGSIGAATNIFVDFVTLGTSTYPAGVSPVPSTCEEHCGDGSPDPNEQCDDGNTLAGDGCSSLCQVEDGYSCVPAQAAQFVDALDDTGFETPGLNDGDPNPNWTETSNIPLEGGFFYPICNNSLGLCQSLSTPVPTADGNGAAWYGGGFASGTQSVSQDVIIPSASTLLTLKALRDACASQGADDMVSVRIDGNTVFSLPCGVPDLAYRDYTVNLATAPGGPYNDGRSHELAISASTRVLDDTDWTSVIVDAVSVPTSQVIDPVPSTCQQLCLTETFDGPGGGDLTGWTVFNTGVLDEDWGTTDDGVCFGNLRINFTGGTGEAACIDSEQAGPGLVDAYLCSPQLEYAALENPTLEFLYNYQIFDPSGEDLFEVLAGTQSPGPGTIGSYASVFTRTYNAGAFAEEEGESARVPLVPQDGYVCFHYVANFDWYAMVDDMSLAADSCTNDSDGDGVSDDQDNCTADANAQQQDNDGDGIGDICDADFNNDCAVNFTDLGQMKSSFFLSGDLETDMNNDNATNFADLGLLKGDFFQPPGPSGIPNVCSP